MSSFKSLVDLEAHLATRSYITGYSLSEDDKKEFQAHGLPAASAFPNVNRWARHVAKLTGLFPVTNNTTAPAAAPAAAKKGGDDDLDLFGDDEDNEDGETAEERAATKARQARMEAARKLKEEKDAKEGKKAKVKDVEKSLVVLEVKPWEADTDLEAVWKEIIKFEKEGLTWGQTFKLEPVAYGIKKLVMTATIVDSLVLLDDVTDNIEAMEDFVQSVEIASMNKI
ncbi:elongation factor 1-beta/delta [archaeon]|nr:MAG: elongation factor 1-beta/delta [archaeon]